MNISFRRTYIWRMACFARDFLRLLTEFRSVLKVVSTIKGEYGGLGAAIFFKVAYARLWRRFINSEILFYRLGERTIDEFFEFISVREGASVCAAINTEGAMFRDKYETYERFKKYFRRNVIKVENTEEFQAFYSSRSHFFLKPVNSCSGQGTRIVNTENCDVRTFIKENEGALAEELIKQTEEMASFNLSSVNTIRIATFKYPDRIDVPFAYFRVGRAGSVCDNGAQGGIICLLDIKTGVITECAAEGDVKYTRHPDSGKQLVGYVMPEWEKAKAMCKEMATMTDNLYVAWDVANTPNGWVIVEGNGGGDFGTQYVNKIGVRKQVKKAVKEMGVNIRWF